MKNGKQSKRIRVSTLITVLAIALTVVAMASVYGFVRTRMDKIIHESTTNSMETMVMEKATIVEKDILDAERYLTAYSRSSDVINLLKNPEDADAVANAQEYTERFSRDKLNLEGIYSSTWQTQILAHTDVSYKGMITRKDPEPLNLLHTK